MRIDPNELLDLFELFHSGTEADRLRMNYMGDKAAYMPIISAIIPPTFSTLTEPYGGMGAVSRYHLMLEEIERGGTRIVYGELDENNLNLIRQLRDNAKEFAERIRVLANNEAWFHYGKKYFEQKNHPEVDRACMYLCSITSSHQSRLKVGHTSGFLHKKRFSKFHEVVPIWSELLQRLIIEHLPALELIRKYDSPSTLHYCDPPYVRSTRKDFDSEYNYELTDEQHQELCETLLKVEGMVMLCGYQNEIYSRAFDDDPRWSMVFPLNVVPKKPTAESTPKQIRDYKAFEPETAWINFPLSDETRRMIYDRGYRKREIKFGMGEHGDLSDRLISRRFKL